MLLQLDSLPVLSTVYLNAAEMSNVTIVLLYTALLVVVTSMISLRTNDPDPMLAGRNMPWWLIAGSIVGTSISSIAFLAYPAKGYAFDFSFLIGLFSEALVGVPLAIFFFVSFLRKSRDASIYTLLSDRFGRWSAVYASIAFIAYSTVKMGVITCLVAQALNLICGVDVFSVILLTGIIVIFYTYMSGIEGVMWTDLFQTMILVGAALSAILFLFQGISSPVCEMLETVQSLAVVSEKNQELQDSGLFLLTSSLFFIATMIEFYVSNQGIAQRYLVARSDRHAKWGLAVGGMCIPWVVVLFFVVGMLLYFFHHANPESMLPGGLGAEHAFAHFIAERFPNGLKGLVIVGILAAAMSTIDTGINSSSTVLICNLYEPYARASALKQSLLTMQILRASSAAFGAAGIFAAYLIYINGQGALEFFWRGLGVVSPGILGLFLLLRVSKKAGPKAAMSGLIVGSILTLWMTFTEGKDYPLAYSYHYMLTLPLSALVIVLIGIGVSHVFPERSRPLNSPYMPSQKIRQQLAARRRRTKKNIFSDSLKPKPFYRLYAGLALIAAFVIALEGFNFGLNRSDYQCLGVAAFLLLLVIALPWVVRNTHSKRYTFFYLTLLGIALPFMGSVALFTHPNEVFFGYFYWLTLIAFGTMVGWTMLGLVSMVATAAAAQLAVQFYAHVGIPDNWATIAVGAMGIFTYFAMDAAKENLVTERTLGRIHTIVEKIYAKVFEVSLDLAQSKRALNFQDLDRLAKSAGDAKLMLSALMGATDINPEETHMELSVRETVAHVLTRFPKKMQNAFCLEGDDDFKVLGNRDIFESIVAHVLDNAFYYVERKEATVVKCMLDEHRKTLTIANNGPTIQPEDAPYIFDLGYTCDKESLGLGLAYFKKMLEAMRSGMRLISKPNEPWVQFRLFFPRYAELPAEAHMYRIDDKAVSD